MLAHRNFHIDKEYRAIWSALNRPILPVHAAGLKRYSHGDRAICKTWSRRESKLLVNLQPSGAEHGWWCMLLHSTFDCMCNPILHAWKIRLWNSCGVFELWAAV